MNAQPRRVIGYYLITWAGMFLTESGKLSGRARDARIVPTMDEAQGVADRVPANVRPVLIGEVWNRAATESNPGS